MKDIQEWETYTISESIEKTGKTEDDLIRAGVEGKLPFHMWCGKVPFGSPRQRREILYSYYDNKPLEWVRIPKEAIAELLFSAGCACTECYSVPENEIITPAIKAFTYGDIMREKNKCPDNSIIPPWIDPDELNSTVLWVEKDLLRIFPDDLFNLSITEKAIVSSDHDNTTNAGNKDNLGKKLSGWKEIIAYINDTYGLKMTEDKLRRAIKKTNARWLQHEGGVKGQGKRVFAYTKKIDNWLKNNRYV